MKFTLEFSPKAIDEIQELKNKDKKMKTNSLLTRIAIDPQVMAGQPVIKGTRLTVPFILGLLAQGMSIQDILQEYNKLAKEDILACLAFAQNALTDNTFLPLFS